MNSDPPKTTAGPQQQQTLRTMRKSPGLTEARLSNSDREVQGGYSSRGEWCPPESREALRWGRWLPVLPVCFMWLCCHLSGCEGGAATPPREKTPLVFSHQLSAETDYYRAGPQAARPADGKMQAGTPVRILKRDGAYIQVEAETGVKGYVMRDNVTLNPRLQQLADAGNAFAWDLYGRLREEEGNLFFSPSSLAMALAMTHAGAGGETREEMTRVLHVSPLGDDLHTAMQQQRLLWLSASQEDSLRLNVANRLWGQEGYEFQADFLEVTREKYGAELARLNFGQNQAASQTINQWVEEQTAKKITNLIPPQALNDLTRLVLTNAVYFHGKWQEPFHKQLTREEQFHLLDGSSVQTPFMYQEGGFRYHQQEGLQLLELPYAEGEFSMVILLPEKRGGLPELERQLTAEQVTGWLKSLDRSRTVEVYLPRFQTTAQFQLNSVLAELGMPSPFDPQRADFTGMNPEGDLYISAVLHKAYVDVNEEGTEAAAATGIVVGVTSAPVDPPPVFRADHPFVYLIRDNSTQSLLFLGRLENPQE